MTTTTNDTEMAFYEPGTSWVFDFAYNIDGKLVCASGETLEQIRERKPTIELLPYEEICRRINEIDTARFSNVKEIDEERYSEMLNILPPMSWSSHRGISSFLVCEAITGSWHSCFMKIGDKYYEGYSNYSAEKIAGRTERFLKLINQ